MGSHASDTSRRGALGARTVAVSTDPISLALGTSTLFGPLPRPLLEQAARASALRHHRRGAPIWEPGDPCTEVVLVVHGRLECRVLVAGALRHWAPNLPGPGDCAGFVSVLAGGGYGCSLSVLEDATLVHLPRATIAELLAADHRFALRVAESLAQGLRNSLVQSGRVALQTPLQRLASMLLGLTHDATWCPLPGTQRQIAAQLGTVREVVGRGLRRLEAEGVLERHGRSVRILRRGELEALLD